MAEAVLYRMIAVVGIGLVVLATLAIWDIFLGHWLPVWKIVQGVVGLFRRKPREVLPR